ncbi:MAG: uroporphyrinogen decarboxylase family protein [Planctomycetota bacterium]
MIGPTLQRDVDFSNVLKVLRREGTPDYLPFYEHIASPGFIARRTGKPFDTMPRDDEAFWPTYVEFWLGMGYDCVPVEVAPRLTLPRRERRGLSHESESTACIRTDEEFDAYDWPDDSQVIDLEPFERCAELIPDNIKLVAGVGAGPFEWATRMMGVMGLSYALVDNPELVGRVFGEIDRVHTGALEQIASMEAVGACRQGDDLGFKTSTFLPPEVLRRHVFPIYKEMTDIAHARNKPFILHSCGNLAQVYDDLVHDCRIDAKHSFEDAILPVHEFKQQYGDRVTPLGGLDVDRICRSDEDELRRYTRTMIERCFEDGHWALGTGNSLTNYMPVENYLVVLEEGLAVAGR